MRDPNSNLRKILSVIWKERPYPTSYKLLIPVLEGVLSKRQVYDGVNNLKKHGIVRVVVNEDGKQEISIKEHVEDKTEELLMEAKLL